MTSTRIVRRASVAAVLTLAGLVQATVPAMAAPHRFRAQTLTLANATRAQYGASALTWSNALASAAGAFARECRFRQSDSRGRYGESLHANTGRLTPEAAVRTAFAGWSSEAARYDYSRPGFSPSTANFTQLVWKSSTQITLAVARCPAGTIFPQASMFVVARYTPPGNYLGRFRQNVGRKVA